MQNFLAQIPSSISTNAWLNSNGEFVNSAPPPVQAALIVATITLVNIVTTVFVSGINRVHERRLKRLDLTLRTQLADVEASVKMLSEIEELTFKLLDELVKLSAELLGHARSFDAAKSRRFGDQSDEVAEQSLKEIITSFSEFSSKGEEAHHYGKKVNVQLESQKVRLQVWFVEKRRYLAFRARQAKQPASQINDLLGKYKTLYKTIRQEHFGIHQACGETQVFGEGGRIEALNYETFGDDPKPIPNLAGYKIQPNSNELFSHYENLLSLSDARADVSSHTARTQASFLENLEKSSSVR